MTDHAKNMLTHEHFFDFVFNDVMLNELLWRADKSTNCFVNDIQPMINANPDLSSKNITVNSNITNSGVYINILDISKNQIGHVSLHLEKFQPKNIVSPGALHIQNNSSNIYQLLSLDRHPDSSNPMSVNYKLSSVNLKNAKNQKTDISDDITNTSKIIFFVLNAYTTTVLNNPLSLYYKRSYNNTVHPQLMTIVRTRPQIHRTALTKTLKGGAKKRKDK